VLLATTSIQARQDGTLDERVVNLQARKELFEALDLIPPEYTFEAASAAVQAAPCSMPGGPTPKPPEGKNHHARGKKRGAGEPGKQRRSSTKSTSGSAATAAAGWSGSRGLQEVAAEAPRTRGRPPLHSYREVTSDSEPEDASAAESGPEDSAPAAAKKKRKLPSKFDGSAFQQQSKYSR
jgi:hypothetical protein